ncbi:MAG TPA: hypothetical protein VMY37_24955 [Thermoguttaceae bacterium]|nr:hypothetical protein [Thermoguttaceae bacterium]
MKYGIALAVLAAACLAVSPGRGQSSDEPSQDLRQLIQSLQQALGDAQQARKADDRVTELGGRPRPAPGMEPAMVVRIYDLSDLFAMAPSYPATISGDLGQPERPMFSSFTGGTLTGGGMGGFGGGMGGMGGGGGLFNVGERAAELPDKSRHVLHQLNAGTAPSVRTSIDELIEAITSTIEPESWDDVGGSGSIAPLGNALLISNEEHVHEQIGTLLDSFRERWGTLRTISTRAYWVWLTDADLDALLAADGQRRPNPEEDVRAFGLVNEAAWQQHMQQLGDRDAERPRGYRAVLTCYNGQTVHTLSGVQSLLVTGIGPELVEGEQLVAVKGDEGVPQARVAYRPELSVVQEGAALQITPIATVSGRFVVVDVHSRIVDLGECGAERGESVKANAKAADVSPRELVEVIDRPKLAIHRLSTTLRVPVDRLMLIGGMTQAHGVGEGDAELYLFLRVSVQELRDDVTRRTPAVEPKPEVEAKPKPVVKPKPGPASEASPDVKEKRKAKPR